MADRYLLESGSPDGYTLEQGGGVLILEFVATPTNVPNALMMMGRGLCVVLTSRAVVDVVPLARLGYFYEM